MIDLRMDEGKMPVDPRDYEGKVVLIQVKYEYTIMDPLYTGIVGGSHGDFFRLNHYETFRDEESWRSGKSRERRRLYEILNDGCGNIGDKVKSRTLNVNSVFL